MIGPSIPSGSNIRAILDSIILFVMILAGSLRLTRYCNMSLIECHRNPSVDNHSFLSRVIIESDNSDRLCNNADVFETHCRKLKPASDNMVMISL